MAIIEKIEHNVVENNYITTTYYDNGDIREQINDAQQREILNQLVNENGEIKESIERTYHENGQPASEIKIDEFCQDETQWREDGQETMYKSVRRKSPTIPYKEREYEFFENGNVKKISYKEDSSIIQTKDYYENGQLATQKDFRDGSRIEYYPNGQLAYKDTGVFKEERGSFVKYYDNGIIEHKVNYSREKSWGSYVRKLSYEEKNQKDGTPIYSFTGNYDYDEREIERRHNDKGILVYETKKIDGGWGRETRRFFDNGKLKSIEANCDNRDGGGHRVFDYTAEFDEQGRVTRYRNNDTTITYTYDGSKTIEKIEGNLAEKVPDKISGNYVERLFSDNHYIGREEGSGIKIDEYDGNKLLKRKVNDLTTEFEYDGDKLVKSTTTNDKGEIVGERTIEYYDNGNIRFDNEYLKDQNGQLQKQRTLYHENGKLAEHFESDEYSYIMKQYNSEGELIYSQTGPKEGLISEMKEYDKTGKILQRSIEPLSSNRLKYTEYGDTETVETIKDSKGNAISQTVTTYHDPEHQKIATSKTVSFKNLAESTIALNENGDKIFEQKVGAFGRLLELYEAYPNGTPKHHLTTHENGVQEETFWNKSGVETSYQKRDLNDKVSNSNQTFYMSGRIASEIAKDGVTKYWDTDRHNISQKIDSNGKIVYEEYENGQKKFEAFSDGSATKWYETGEVLCQKDERGNQEYFYKNGDTRLTIQTNGDKNTEYNAKQYLLISGRHCHRDGAGLSDIGKEQAKNIGKFLAYATQGKIAGLPNVIVPEVCSFTNNPRSEETAQIIMQSLNDKLQTSVKCEIVEGTVKGKECRHSANSELSIHSLGGFYDVADAEMGSIAFSVVGRDGFVVDRSVFNAEQIARKIKEVEIRTKALEQIITDKLDKIRDMEKAHNTTDVPHVKTKVLRKIGQDNLGRPKRSKADKNIIKSALDHVAQKR